jgi:hypothetical protein
LKKGKASEAMKAAAKRGPRSGRVVDAWLASAARGRASRRADPAEAQPGPDLGNDVGGHGRGQMGQSLAREAAVANKIDAAVALCMAMGAAAATVSKPAFEMMII